MITDAQSGTRIDEIENGIYRICVPVGEELLPGGFSFSHFLVAGDEPLLFHTGYRRTFPLISAAIATVLDPKTLRYIAYSHHEADESGAAPQFLQLAPQAQVLSSDIGAMTAAGDLFDGTHRGLADGEEIQAGSRKFKWLATPHIPHGWDCGVLFETTSKTLFCGDLFTQGGMNNQPVTDSEILTRSEQFRAPMDYFAHARNTSTVLEKLAALEPRLLAPQHGSSYRGDGAALLRELSKTV
jgi:flavorubredoxin